MTHVRTLLHGGSKLFTAMVVAALVFTWTTNAQANHQPANKIAAAGSVEDEPFIVAGEPVLLLQETFKTSKPTDLLLNVAAECSIVTEVTTVGNDTSTASGQLEFFLTKVTSDGDPTTEDKPERIGVTQESTAPNEDEDGDTGEVVFCNRTYQRETTLFNDDDATIRTFMETRNANSFNWLELNAGSGVHTVSLYAQYTEAEDATKGEATAEGVVGARTMIIEPVRAKNDEHVDTLDTDG